MAQALKDVQVPDTPLVLKAQGSFFVGGDNIEQTRGELGDLGPGGHIAVNQMYVRYMVPQGGEGKVPVVMVHGATLTGKSWETTPDGRMGWDEYFVRKGHPVYVPDQVGRGRSGFNQAVFNNVRAGSTPPPNQPLWLRFSDESVWPNFRFGLTPGQPFSDSQFPVTAVDELAKQAVPDVSFGGLPTPNPTLKALADLAGQLNGAVLMGHSQSGSFPLESALLNPGAAKGLVLVEPGSCPARYTADQIATLAKVPMLVVFGDHRDTPTGLPTLPTWQARFEACQALIGRLKNAGLQAVAPKFVQLTNDVVFDDLWRRSDLSVRDRSLVTIAALAAMGDDDQLDLYLRRAIESGLTRAQITEALTHLGFYAGWPKATKAIMAITRSLAK
ncbi:MAG TPA: carboxymuconolactone decarboxylase family protein [Mycobacterium sp.]|nr:carboxymuconolactone decarboxylase family protein [Mycobacterium sp.]